MRVENGNQTSIEDRDIDVLYDEIFVQHLVKQLAHEVSEFYGDTPFTMIGILNACGPFMFDLLSSRATWRYDLLFISSGTNSPRSIIGWSSR